MIREFEFYHGVVFSKLIHGLKLASIKLYPTVSNSSYIINDDIGTYVKYSSKRISPWQFSFKKIHRDEILEMKTKTREVFILLVCHDDGVLVLNFDEFKNVVDFEYKNMEWISVARRSREKYSIKGSGGKLRHKIGANEFPYKLIGKNQK